MTLQVIGAGVGRTGTHSLKAAFEQLFEAPCYHMTMVGEHPEHVEVWQAAADGKEIDWVGLFDDYDAAVDWPASAFWPELAEAFPDALVLLSTRDSPETWWRSTDATVFDGMRKTPPPESADWNRMVFSVLDERFSPDFLQEGPAKRAYQRHNAKVREQLPAERLLEWQPGDGWEPICERLGLPVPDHPFPHTDTTEQFRVRRGLDEAQPKGERTQPQPRRREPLRAERPPTAETGVPNVPPPPPDPDPSSVPKPAPRRRAPLRATDPSGRQREADD